MNPKKIMALVLAVLLGLGVLSPLLYVVSSATDGNSNSSSDTEEEENPVGEIISVDAAFSGTKPNMSTIKRRNKLSLLLTVADYGYVFKEGDNAEVSFYNGYEAFPLQSNIRTSDIVVIPHTEAGKNYTRYTLEIPVVYSGKGNSLSFDLRINGGDKGKDRTLRCQTAIPRVEEYVEEPDMPENNDDEKTPAPLTPYIIVESYDYGGSSVTAGEDFYLDLNLRNTSETHSLQNIIMNISPQGVFSMGGTSNTIYIEKLFAGSTINKKIKINTGLTKVTDNQDANSIGIKFDFQYLNDQERLSGTSAENITIPVNFPDRFQLSPAEMESTAMLGEEWYIYIPMTNKGRSDIYNLEASLICDAVDNSGTSQYIGSLSAGSQSGVDFSVSFNAPGTQTGEVKITYEDSNENPKEVSVPFTVEVEEMYFPEEDFSPEGMMPDMPAEVPQEPKMPKAPFVIAGIVVAAISAYVTVTKAKAKRSIFTDEEN